jgi:hypothetical protein
MKYYVVGFIQGNSKWYLSIVNPPKGTFYGSVLGVELAAKFSSEKEAKEKIIQYVKGKSVRGIFTYEVNITNMLGVG